MSGQITMKVNWEFTLEPDDAVLVLKALGGRLRDDSERARAKELGDSLTKARAKQAADFSRMMELHASKVKEE